MLSIVRTILLIFFFLILTNQLQSQTRESRQPLFLDFYFGGQVSGIRKEDYIKSNFSPYLHLSAGKGINQKFSIRFGYQGPYFNFIGDDVKHKYYFLNSEIYYRFLSIFKKSGSKLISFEVLLGSGYLHNYHYNKSNFCINAGGVSSFKLSKTLALRLKGSAIFGWKIYQDDKDALPNFSIGLSKEI